MYKCAPLLVPTLCRDKHFIRMIESLKRNSWAKYTPVYVALDYPPAEKYFSGYNKICEYLEGEFPEFLEFNIVKRDVNYGSMSNMQELEKEVLKKHDRFIRTDDDAEFSSNFLEYMNKCLEKYKDDPNVFAVTGYSYPIQWNVSPGATILKENFSCPMWGTGFWRDKFLKVSTFINSNGLLNSSQEIVADGKYKCMIDRCKYEFVNLCLSTSNDELTLANCVSDVALRIYTAAYNKYVIVPLVSKVRNWGFDGTGEYCQQINKMTAKVSASNYLYHLQPIDTSPTFNIEEDKFNDVQTNMNIMNDFDVISLNMRLKMNIKLLMYRVLGSCIYKKLMSVIR